MQLEMFFAVKETFFLQNLTFVFVFFVNLSLTLGVLCRF